MDNLARKFENPKEVVDSFTKAHGSTELLKMFMLTSSNDVSKINELLKSWEKDSKNDADKTALRSAQKTLKAVVLKRVELTGIMYGVETTSTVSPITEQIAVVATGGVIEEKEIVVESEPIKLLVPMTNIIENAKSYLKEASEKIKSTENITDELAGNIQAEAFANAFHLMKETLGAGNYLTADGKKSKTIWQGEEISDHLDVISKEFFAIDNSNLETVKSQPAEIKEFTYNDIAAMVKASFEANRTVDLIIEEVRTAFFGGKIKDNNTVIDTEDKFTTIIGYVNNYFNSLVTINKPVETKEVVLSKAKESLTEELKKLDADPKANSIHLLIIKLREFFLNNNASIPLKESKAAVETFVKENAQNLWNRYISKSSNAVIIVAEETPSIDIYDNSHNYETTNPELYAAAKEITTMDAMFAKAKQLVEEKKWKDALAMVIHLTSNNQIAVSDTVKLTFTEDQAKGWFKQNILETKPVEQIAEATIVADETHASETDQVKVEEGSAEVVQPVEQTEVKQGPVPKAGFDPEAAIYPQIGGVPAEDKGLVAYYFETKMIPKKGVTFMVTDSDVSVDFPCYSDFENKMNEIVGILSNNSNDYKKAKAELTSFLSVYEVTPSVIKTMLTRFTELGIADRKARKAESKSVIEKPAETTEETTTQETETVVETPVETVVVEPSTEESVVETVVEETPAPETTTEDAPVVEPTPQDDTVVATQSGETAEDSAPLAESQIVVEEKSASPESSTTQETVVTETTSGSDTAEIDPITFKALQPILIAKDKSSFNKAIGRFCNESSDPAGAEDIVFTAILKYRKDKAYKKCKVNDYRSATDEHLRGTIKTAVENSKNAPKA